MLRRNGPVVNSAESRPEAEREDTIGLHVRATLGSRAQIKHLLLL